LLHVLETSGENHPFLGVVFRSRAGLYLAVGQAERGLPYADSAIVAFERSLSRLHPDTRSGYRMRGEILAASGRDAEARTDLEEAYFRAREAGEPASDLESTGELLIGVYNRLGDRAGADSLRADR
jgi:tetratricopeptide (TPR) repeat protein